MKDESGEVFHIFPLFGLDSAFRLLLMLAPYPQVNYLEKLHFDLIAFSGS